MAARYSTLVHPSFLRQHLVYDEITGSISRVGRPVSAWQGKPIRQSTKYRTITFKGQMYMHHRVAWALWTGEWPTMFIDHINGNKHDNRICNLRQVSSRENVQNQRRAHVSNKSSGLLGVTVKANGKCQARIFVGGKNLYLGSFDDAESAHEAYLVAKRKFHPSCTI